MSELKDSDIFPSFLWKQCSCFCQIPGAEDRWENGTGKSQKLGLEAKELAGASWKNREVNLGITQLLGYWDYDF